MKKNLLFSIFAVCLVSMMSFSCAVMNAVGEIVAVVGVIFDTAKLPGNIHGDKFS